MSLLHVCSFTAKHLSTKGLLVESLFTGCSRAVSGATGKEPLRKAKTPVGRLDVTEEEKSKDVLEKFPEDVNPVTKEQGGPRGPEPTRYGDWERKGRCVDF